MSTIFGIHRWGKKIELVNDKLPDGYSKDDEFIDVAFRSNQGGIIWDNTTAQFLDDSIPVYPLDNTAQGIYTIGDLKKKFNEQNKRK